MICPDTLIPSPPFPCHLCPGCSPSGQQQGSSGSLPSVCIPTACPRQGQQAPGLPFHRQNLFGFPPNQQQCFPGAVLLLRTNLCFTASWFQMNIFFIRKCLKFYLLMVFCILVLLSKIRFLYWDSNAFPILSRGEKAMLLEADFQNQMSI